MVFDPAVAPRDRKEFLAWYYEQVDWPDDDSAFNPDTACARLQKWYGAIVGGFPNMQEIEDDDPRIDSDLLTDYSFREAIIYVAFRWTVADSAYETVRRLAKKYEVGFYDVSGDDGNGEIYFPGDTLRPPSQGAWRTVAADFRSGDLSKYVPQSEQPKRRWFDFFRRT